MRRFLWQNAVFIVIGIVLLAVLWPAAWAPGLVVRSVDAVTGRLSQVPVPYGAAHPYEPDGSRPDSLFHDDGGALRGHPQPVPATNLLIERVAGGVAIKADGGGPMTRLHWVADDRAILEWGDGLFLVEMNQATVRPIIGYDEVDGVSPDGVWVYYESHYPVNPRAWLVNAKTGERWSTQAGVPRLSWLGADLAVEAPGQESWPAIYEPNAKRYRGFDRALGTVRLANGELCWATGYGEYILCQTPGGVTRTLSTYRVALAPGATGPVPDPSRSRIAFIDRRGEEKFLWLGLGAAGLERVGFGAGVAGATKPTPPVTWVDTVLIYDPVAEKVMLHRFPGRQQVQQMLWSADGTRLGFRVAQVQGKNIWQHEVSDFLVLDLTTGAWHGPWTAGGKAELERVTADGVIITQDGHLQTLPGGAQLFADARRVPVTGSEPLPNPGSSGIGLDWAFVRGSDIEVVPPARDVQVWRAGVSEVEQVILSPERRWLGVQTSDGRLLILAR